LIFRRDSILDSYFVATSKIGFVKVSKDHLSRSTWYSRTTSPYIRERESEVAVVSRSRNQLISLTTMAMVKLLTWLPHGEAEMLPRTWT